MSTIRVISLSDHDVDLGTGQMLPPYGQDPVEIELTPYVDLLLDARLIGRPDDEVAPAADNSQEIAAEQPGDDDPEAADPDPGTSTSTSPSTAGSSSSAGSSTTQPTSAGTGTSPSTTAAAAPASSSSSTTSTSSSGGRAGKES